MIESNSIQLRNHKKKWVSIIYKDGGAVIPAGTYDRVRWNAEGYRHFQKLGPSKLRKGDTLRLTLNVKWNLPDRVGGTWHTVEMEAV